VREVPTEIWIKIAQYVAALGPDGFGRVPSHKSIGNTFVESVGVYVPHLRALSAASKYFELICQPICYEHIIWTESFDKKTSPTRQKLVFARSFKCEYEILAEARLPIILSWTAKLEYLEIQYLQFTIALSRAAFSLPTLRHLHMTCMIYNDDLDGDYLAHLVSER
jgi:hypothetical protein